MSNELLYTPEDNGVNSMRFYMVGKGKSIVIWDILSKTFYNSKFSTIGNYILFIGIKCISFPGIMNAYQLFSTFQASQFWES